MAVKFLLLKTPSCATEGSIFIHCALVLCNCSVYKTEQAYSESVLKRATLLNVQNATLDTTKNLQATREINTVRLGLLDKRKWTNLIR